METCSERIVTSFTQTVVRIFKTKYVRVLKKIRVLLYMYKYIIYIYINTAYGYLVNGTELINNLSGFLSKLYTILR